MSGYTLGRTVEMTYARALDATRAGLVEQGFGVLTEIDLAATLHDKVGATLPPQMILGACRPQLAYEAVLADPSIASVLPCNVVVRSINESTTVVEAFDPAAMMGLTGVDTDADRSLAVVASDARERLQAMLAALA